MFDNYERPQCLLNKQLYQQGGNIYQIVYSNIISLPVIFMERIIVQMEIEEKYMEIKQFVYAISHFQHYAKLLWIACKIIYSFHSKFVIQLNNEQQDYGFCNNFNSQLILFK
ncbi:hypothetical protein pb186bvf_018934 [Paramecium bursaria]